jgi:hypothetical protein
MQELKNANSQAIQELKNAIITNTRDIQGLHQAMSRLKGQMNHLVELNRIEEEEFQSQMMTEKHYLVDEDEVVDNEEEQVEHIERVEHHEKSKPPIDPNLPSDMEVSIEALACITISLETHQEKRHARVEECQLPSYTRIEECHHKQY